jgi:hypothetical protein
MGAENIRATDLMPTAKYATMQLMVFVRHTTGVNPAASRPVWVTDLHVPPAASEYIDTTNCGVEE